MSCGRDAERCKGAGAAAGIADTIPTWAAGRRGGGHCPKCGGFLTAEGVCNNPRHKVEAQSFERLESAARDFEAAVREVQRGNRDAAEEIFNRAFRAYNSIHGGGVQARAAMDDCQRAMTRAHAYLRGEGDSYDKVERPAGNLPGIRTGYRVATGFTHRGTADEVVDYEMRELGNDIGVTPEIRAALRHKNAQAKDLVWVCKDSGAAKRYADGDEEAIEKVELPTGSVIIGQDGDGGYLVWKGAAERLPETESPGARGRTVRPQADYFEREINRVNPAWLDGFVESPGFSRQDGERILSAIRRAAIEKLAGREYDGFEAVNRAVAAINANTLRHSAQVMVMATKIAALVGADEKTKRQSGLAAGLHDGGKDNTNFVYHHLDSANLATKILRETGLSSDAQEIAAVRQAIMEHMPFGNGGDPDNFVNRALAGEAAAIVKATRGTERQSRLRHLMKEALQKSEQEIGRVEAWVRANEANYATKDELAEALRREFGGKELSYPRPGSQAARIVNNAAIVSGEHLGEVVKGDGGQSLLEAGYSAAEITWAADGLTLASAESLEKIVEIHQRQWGRAGSEPIVVSMSSLAGGAFGNGGTAVDAARSMTISAVRQAAETEIGLMRQFMVEWQATTVRRWLRGGKRTAAEIAGKKAAFERDPFTALSSEEMLEFQPGLDEFKAQFAVFLRRNAHRRGALALEVT